MTGKQQKSATTVISMTVVAALGHDCSGSTQPWRNSLQLAFRVSFDIEFFFHFWLYFDLSFILTFNMVLLLHSKYFKFSFHFPLIFHISFFFIPR